MNKKTMILMALVALFLIGCGVLSSQTNIFEHPSCSPPCWEGITPGLTTKEEALNVLSKLNMIDQPIVDPNQAFINFDDAFPFTFYHDINRWGFIYIFDGKVSTIAFDNKLNLNLQQAVELFGNPKIILVEHAGEYDSAMFINPEKGISFGYRFHLDETSVVGPDATIDSVAFFDAKQYQSVLSSGLLSFTHLNADEILNRMRPWKGYGSIYQYDSTSTP
ncbi:MAG TPA: hypothetical protein VLX61_00730 [Anaerolineales bacterium]|nr:hypothetical protein [Anaerolineales bacterium]